LGKASRDKGSREERSIVNFWREQGVPRDAVKRVPLSGASEGYKNDIVLCGFEGEAKVRAQGFKMIYDYLGDADFLTIRSDQHERLYLWPESNMVKLGRLAGWMKLF
jgi:hypothetical protein|tara:strand:- start:2172 stop:2492 length:321 start_codon:yes stop_codon:yes gene_type:complete